MTQEAHRSFRAVLFDWDGTVVRDDPLVVTSPAAAVAHYARQTLHLALRDAPFDAAFQAVLPPYAPGVTTTSPNIHSLLVATFTNLGWALEASQIEACAAVFFDEASARQQVFDDARAILSSLKYRGYRIGVITNSIFPGRLFTPHLGKLGLAGYVDVVISSADTVLGKPAPEPYLAALKVLGVEPQEALFVGDRVESDIAGARAAGVRAVLIDRSAKQHEAAGHLVISHLSALNEILGDEVLGC